MFINLSNHPSQSWEERQIKAASRYGEIVDWPFPPIPAEEGEEYIRELTTSYMKKIVERYQPRQDVFHIMGEMCFTFALVKSLQELGFTCMASTSERIVKEEGPGYKKEVSFRFARFREYL